MGKNYYLKDRDILDQALEHSWGKSSEAKAKERAYNREYYQRHKEEILRKARQAGEGIQRTAQNAYNAVRTEASALSRAASSPHARSRVNEGNPSVNAYKRPRFSDEQLTNWANYETARRNMNAARNTPGEAAAQRELARRANRLSSTSTAINERAKDASQYGPEARFDSKLVRDAQNAYSKVRGKGREAKREIDSAMTKARANVEDAVGGIGRKIKDAKMATYPGRRPGEHAPSYQDIDRYRNAHVMNNRLVNDAKDRTNRANVNERKASSKYDRLSKSRDANYAKAEKEFIRSVDLNADSRTRGYARDAKNDAINYERKGKTYGDMAANAAREHLESLREVDRAKANQRRMANRRAASGAALNEAKKAHRAYTNGAYDIKYDSKLARDLQNTKAKARGAMSKAEKAAQQAREDAKKRMKKWFNR